jgi:DNA-binding transcriptional ArsR family regulator
VEPLGKIRDRGVGTPELLQNAAPGGVRKRGERGIEAVPSILNHKVQCLTHGWATHKGRPGAPRLAVRFAANRPRSTADQVDATIPGSWRTPCRALTIKVVNATLSRVLDIQVIEDPAAATVALGPIRSRLLAELGVPASAASLATRVGLGRQKINYHLRALEAHGLVQLAQERTWGGLTERLLVATASSYVVSPSALGPIATDPSREIDRLSASYLIALGARVVREMGELVRRAQETGKRLATLSVDTEVRFRSATDRAAFSSELTEAITRLVSKYHNESAPGGRAHRLVVVAHPLPQKSDLKEPA